MPDPPGRRSGGGDPRTGTARETKRDWNRKKHPAYRAAQEDEKRKEKKTGGIISAIRDAVRIPQENLHPARQMPRGFPLAAFQGDL